jgi:hypothetical protein
LLHEHKSFMHASRRPNHLASSFLDSRGEIESDKRLVFDNQYRDLIQQRISPRGNVAPMAVVCQQSLGGVGAISQRQRRSIGIEIKGATRRAQEDLTSAAAANVYPPFHAARVFAENVARVTDTVVPFGPAKVSTWAPS